MPQIDPAQADYAHADVVVPARVSFGDGEWQALQFALPAMRGRQLLPVWQQLSAQTGVISFSATLQATQPSGQPDGIMRLEVAADPVPDLWWLSPQ
ncbi:MAG: hypothetical protein HRT62_20595 [Epibacterium sp.]|nr:hypothetical protein [Epibacterium sp.]